MSLRSSQTPRMLLPLPTRAATSPWTTLTLAIVQVAAHPDFNLDVERGDTVAIVGPTGAGKTTLVNLLMRFYEIQGGTITFDGVDTHGMRRGDLRTMFGMVLQDTWLFNGTVRENIAYARDDATADVIAAAKAAAHADHFIRSLPQKGYDTVLDEDASNISAGQKQLLTIARVVLANPSVLILDEATSSVDTRTRCASRRPWRSSWKARTSFVIAHRLSTIRDAHLVANHGTIVEQGTHRSCSQRADSMPTWPQQPVRGGSRHGRHSLTFLTTIRYHLHSPGPAPGLLHVQQHPLHTPQPFLQACSFPLAPPHPAALSCLLSFSRRHPWKQPLHGRLSCILMLWRRIVSSACKEAPMPWRSSRRYCRLRLRVQPHEVSGFSPVHTRVMLDR